jgi:hypothetical protein
MRIHYPLYRDETPLFDIHSLRVTLVTYLLDEDVDINIVRDLVGHQSNAMTWYYNGLRAKQLNTNIMVAMARRHHIVEKAAAGDADAMRTLADEAFLGGNTGVDGAPLLREMADDIRPAIVDFFMHGLCVAGECHKGGVPIKGVEQRVWRDRACSECRFRVTGSKFLPGIVARVNALALEIKDSFRRSEDFNKRIMEQETATGKPQFALREGRAAEDRLRNLLCREWAVESRTAFLIEAKERANRKKGRTQPIVVIGKERIDPALLTLGVTQVDELELLHMVAEEAVADPSAELDFRTPIRQDYVSKIKRIVAVNGLSDIMYKRPTPPDDGELLSCGRAMIEVFGPSKMREFIENSDEIRPSGELAEPAALAALAEQLSGDKGHFVGRG